MDLKDMSSHRVKNFISHFVQGLIVIAPFIITIYIGYKVVGFLTSTLGYVPKMVHPLLDPLIILVSFILVIYVIGLLSSSLLFTPMYSRFEKDIEKVPLVRIVYTSVKDLMSAFVGSKKKFKRPVLVTLDKANNIKQLGFITQEDLSDMGIDKEYMGVYMPFSYGFSGKLLIVHKDNVTPVDGSSTDLMKFIVSGGVTHVD
jgi:uncharacterized membrane protein